MSLENGLGAASIRPLVIIGICLVLLQVGIFSQIPIDWLKPNGWCLIWCMVAMALGSRAGSITGFICGLCYDLASGGPVGVMACIGAVLGFAAGLFQRDLFKEELASALLMFTAIIVGAEIAYPFLLNIFGAELPSIGGLVARIVGQSIVSLVVAAVIYQLLSSQKLGSHAAPRGGGASSVSQRLSVQKNSSGTRRARVLAPSSRLK